MSKIALEGHCLLESLSRCAFMHAVFSLLPRNRDRRLDKTSLKKTQRRLAEQGYAKQDFLVTKSPFTLRLQHLVGSSFYRKWRKRISKNDGNLFT